MTEPNCSVGKGARSGGTRRFTAGPVSQACGAYKFRTEAPLAVPRRVPSSDGAWRNEPIRGCDRSGFRTRAGMRLGKMLSISDTSPLGSVCAPFRSPPLYAAIVHAYT